MKVLPSLEFLTVASAPLLVPTSQTLLTASRINPRPIPSWGLCHQSLCPPFSLETSFSSQASALRPLQPWSSCSCAEQGWQTDPPGSQIPANLITTWAASLGPLGWLLAPAPLSPFRSCFPCILLLSLIIPNNYPNITNDHSNYILRHSYSASCPWLPIIKSSPWPSTLGQGERTHKNSITRASLVAQWLRIRLPIQGTRVRSLAREECCGATKPVCHNYWACAVEPASHNYWRPRA